MLDILKNICYNIKVAWRDGRVGLRRTTGNRVNHNRFHGFESHSLRQRKESFCLSKALFFCLNEKSCISQRIGVALPLS